MSISKEDYYQKITHEKEEEVIINDMANSCLMLNEKDEDYNEISYSHSFSNDSFDHSALYYDAHIIDDHMSYDELLDAFEESFIK